jgi:acetylornithine deacetylase/succinyl-diaminopimelate desuccinylase-like protein
MFLIYVAISSDISMDREGTTSSEYQIANACYSISSAHGPNEHVTKADLLEAVEGYKKLILHALK